MVEFRNSRKNAIPLIASISISVITILMVAVTFFLGLLSSDSIPLMPGLVGGLCVIPIFGISFAIHLLKSPSRILVSESGLSVEWLIGQKTFSWNTISRLDIKKPGVYQNWASSFGGKKNLVKEILVIFDHKNKKIVEIGDNIESFSALMQEIRERSSMTQGKTTFDTKEHLQKTISAQKRGRIFLLVFGIFFAILSITMTITSLVANHNKQLLEKQGQIIEATISKHYLHNITPRIEYSFTTPEEESFSKNVMVHKTYWETLTENGSVSVKYLPSNPKQNKLLYDDADDEDFPLILVIPVSAFGIIFSGMCIVMYFLKITDLKFEDGHFKIVRVGDVDSKIISETLAKESDTQSLDNTEEAASLPIKPIISSVPQMTPCDPLPKGLKAIGILNIVFGGLGVLWSIGRIILMFIFVNNPDLVAENMALPEDTSWVFVEHLFSAAIALLLAVSGIGILLLKNWARVLAIVVVAVKLLLGLKEIGLALFAIVSATEGIASEQEFVLKVTMAFLIFVIVLTMIYPAIVFILLKRKTTREVFKRKQVNGLDELIVQ